MGYCGRTCPAGLGSYGSCLAEASDAAYERGLAFLPGLEISAEAGAEVHILGYGVDANDPVLTAFFSQMAKERIDRFWAMGQKLRQMGFGLELDEILKSAGNSVGRATPLCGVMRPHSLFARWRGPCAQILRGES